MRSMHTVYVLNTTNKYLFEELNDTPRAIDHKFKKYAFVTNPKANFSK